VFTRFDPQPPPDAAPAVMPSPFRPGPPDPLVARAALATQARLDALPAELRACFHGRFGGKMVGVLVARDRDGALGYLCGFAGLLDGRSAVAGFVPPAYDVDAFERIWDTGAPEITALDRERAELLARGDQRDAAAMREAQAAVSRSVHAALHDTYQLANARGQRRSLRELFEPRNPPGGAGDCAAPKLLAHAYARDLRPLALAEFWWGGPPPSGGRQHGVFYPACRGRCGVILPFMLDGLPCEPPPDVGMLDIAADEPRTVFEDDELIAIDKPSGLLSVPGRGPRRRDSVEHRLQQRCELADPSWPRLVHRLDLATSGLLIAAKAKPIYVALQRQFSARTVVKRYVALVAGGLDGDEGIIDLPLTRDLDDRPRQLVDRTRGKPARTRWRVLAREGPRTRVALEPETGRTHQLRLHAAHSEGLGAAIVGDRLYGFGFGSEGFGFGGERLMLHAAQLELVHPRTGARLRLESPVPF